MFRPEQPYEHCWRCQGRGAIMHVNDYSESYFYDCDACAGTGNGLYFVKQESKVKLLMNKLLNKLKTFFRQPPAKILKAFREVKSKYVYRHWQSGVSELTHRGVSSVVVRKLNRPKDATPQQQNCVGFALKFREALGGGTMKIKDTLDSTEKHAVLVYQGWELDNFARAPRWVGIDK